MSSAGGDSSGEEGGLQIDVGKTDGRQTKARGKGAKVTKAVNVSWKPGDIVWAKVSGFNYWPAKVFDPSSVPKWLSEPPKPNYILVRFFGSYDMQWVSQRLIEDYEKGFKKKFQSKSRSKLFQKSVKEVREYVENGITPEGLTQPVQDPDAHSSSEGEKEEEREVKANDMVAAASGNEAPQKKETKRSKVVKVKDSELPSSESGERQQTSSGDVSQSSSSNSNGSRSRRRKGSPRKLSSSSADNLDETNPSKKAKLDTVEERERAVGDNGGAERKGVEEIQAFTSAPLPLTANSEKSQASKASKSAESDGGVAVDDVDTLESELMALQHSVQNRINLLESELAVLDSWQVKREYRKRKHSDTGEVLTQRAQISESQLTKKPRLELDKCKKVKSMPKKSKTQSMEVQSSVSEDHTHSAPADHALAKAKGDVLDRFWASVEPYCADITETEINMLEEGMKSHDSGDDPYSVPSLGVHYSKRWAIEDLHSEQSESSRLAGLADPLLATGKGKKAWREEGESILKSAESHQQSSEDKFQYGPLTERLIAAFLEDPAGKSNSSKPHGGHRIDPPINLPQVQALETRIRNELITLGLFEPEEDTKSENGGERSEVSGIGGVAGEGEDEILAELQRKQAELKAVVEYNMEQRKILLSLAKVEMRRQELRQQAKEADEEVMEWLQRITANKQKRKGISRKEKEAAWRALEQRDTIQAKMMA